MAFRVSIAKVGSSAIGMGVLDSGSGHSLSFEDQPGGGLLILIGWSWGDDHGSYALFEGFIGQGGRCTHPLCHDF